MRGIRYLMSIGVGVVLCIGTVASQTETFATESADEPAAESTDELAAVQRVFEADIRLFNGQDPTVSRKGRVCTSSWSGEVSAPC